MPRSRTLITVFTAIVASSTFAHAQQWQPLKNKAHFNAGAVLLLTDGTVIVHSEQADLWNWYKLRPDHSGSYINGTWKRAARMPSGYEPLYFGSAVLADGRLLIEGGEYNNGDQIWTNKGAIYDPVTDKWTMVKPPKGWSTVGDASTVILANTTLMLANSLTSQAALFNARKLSWTSTGKGKADSNEEEGWTLLPSGDALTVDAYGDRGNGKGSEIYNPATGRWSSAGSTIVRLWDTFGSHEIGPAVLRPDGTVLATGANGQGAGHTAIYNTATGKWSKGPDFPDNLNIADGPAALEINGNVIMMASPGVFDTGAVFFEWDGSKLSRVSGPPNASHDSSFQGHFLVLPDGHLMFTDFTKDIEILTPQGTYQSSWQPAITSAPRSLTRGKSYLIKGTQFNGLSQGAAYGDDFQSATNFPLVRLVNRSSGHVFYCRTKDHSTMGVQTGSAIVSTHFMVPADAETGASTLYVVANGIPSPGASVTVK